MNKMKWLLQREFWEHKGSMFWAPVVVAVVMLFTFSSTLIYGLATKGLHATVNGHQLHKGAVFNGLPPEVRSDVVNAVSGSYLVTAAPLFAMLGIVVFFYCLGALYDERRDRSILFWKSLPASDQVTVLSKVVTAICVTPVITIAVATAMSLALLFFTSAALAFNGVNLFLELLARPQLYLAPFALLSLLPVYALWALPTIGWLFLVSSWARSKVFIWAVGAPLIALLIAKLSSTIMTRLFDMGPDTITHFMGDLVARALTGVVPGIWFKYQEVDPALLMVAGRKGPDLAGIVSQSYLTLASPDAWFGVAAGAAMIFAAMRLRRYRDEG